MSKTRCANTVPTSVAHAPFRSGIFRVRTATRASSPIRPGSTAFANRPTENAEKTSIACGRGGSIAEWITVVQASARATTESEVQADRDDDPLPPDVAERAADRGEAAAPPPDQRGERRRGCGRRTRCARRARRQSARSAVRPAGSSSSSWSSRLHRAIIVGGPDAPPLAPRPRDRPARAARARRARGGAALRPRRHRDRRSPRPAADRRARPRGDSARRRVHDLQLPHVRDDGGRRARVGRRPPGARPRGSRRRRSGRRSGSASRCSSAARSSPRRSCAGSAGTAQSGHYALTYFRIAAFGLPAALVALAGQGYLRGVSNLRRPLEIVVVANVANLVLEVALRLRLPLGNRRLGGGNGDRAGRDGRRVRRRAAAPARAVAPAELARDAADGPRRPADLRPHRGALRVLPRRRLRPRADGRRARSARTRSRTSSSSSSRSSSTRSRSRAR